MTIITIVVGVRNALKKLARRLEETEFSTYSLYLQHDRIKCLLKLGKFKKTRQFSKQMFSDAVALGSIAWQVNALMTVVIAESRLGNTVKCTESLELIVSLSRTLGNENVTAFFRKVRTTLRPMSIITIVILHIVMSVAKKLFDFLLRWGVFFFLGIRVFGS